MSTQFPSTRKVGPVGSLLGLQPNEEQKGKCPICQGDEGDGPLDAFCDHCGHIKHYMHTRCLNEYLSYGQNVCPVCKSSPCKPWQMVNELVNDAGPQVHDDVDTVWCEAISAPAVLDTCGSGDMVSVGVIDWMLTNRLNLARPRAADLIEGIQAGQRLAAENCAYAGARGLFKCRGADYVRDMLSMRYSAATK